MTSPQWHRHHHITRSQPSREVRRQQSAWRYLPLLIALATSLGLGFMAASKAIPQAAYDAAHFDTFGG